MIEVNKMESKKLIILFSLGFSAVFSIVYYILFATLQTHTASDAKTIYYNQVGLYQKQESIDSMKQTLQDNGLDTYVLKTNDLSAVVTGVSLDQEGMESVQAKLKEMNINFVEKNITVEDPEIISLLEQNSYEEALERLP